MNLVALRALLDEILGDMNRLHTLLDNAVRGTDRVTKQILCNDANTLEYLATELRKTAYTLKSNSEVSERVDDVIAELSRFDVTDETAERYHALGKRLEEFSVYIATRGDNLAVEKGVDRERGVKPYHPLQKLCDQTISKIEQLDEEDLKSCAIVADAASVLSARLLQHIEATNQERVRRNIEAQDERE